MLHLGDITKISGYTAPIVDVVVGGSPCQDLSVAGKRAGLDGERSGLFMEQLRVIKEMRENDRRIGRSSESVRPRYMVWENVPGAFSSNKAEDFRIVLEETAKVKDPNAVIPMPDNGKWTTSGCILGDGWSIAWRVCDAQFYGVPQRRRRIALIADFGGHSAPEILFVRKSVSRDSEPSQPQRKEATSDASRSLGTDDCVGVDIYNTALTGDKVCPLTAGGTTSTGTCPKVMTPINNDDIFCIDGDKLNKQERKGGSGIGYREGDKQYTLTAKDVHGVAYSFEPGIASREGGHIYEDVSGTIRAKAGDNQMATAYTLQDREGKAGGGKGALIAKDLSATLRAGFAQTLFQPVYSVENHPADSRVNLDESGKVQTLTSRMGTGGGNVPMVMECFSKSKRAQSDTDYETWKESDVANTLNAFDVGDKRTNECVVALDRASFNQGKNAKYDFEISDKGINSPLVAKGPSAVAYPEVSDGVVGTLDGHYANFPGCRGGMERTMVASVDCRNALENEINGALQSNMAHSLNGNNVVRTKYIVRRLTPLECERLQGYPDGWTDIGEWTDSKGKVHKTSDAARYKALGNSIALPPWKWVLKRLCACYERDATLASLFDGIGGFPLIWEQLNGKGSCLWASEIEEFPIAVTKKRIGE